MTKSFHNELPLLIEALLLSIGKSMTIEEIAAVFPELERPSKEEIRSAIDVLADHNHLRGIELIQVADGYQFRTKIKYANLVARLWEEKPAKYSRALLETLALIAYRQPITRGEIEQIRGVTISPSIFKTLQEEREWIRVIGYKDVPGKPGLYATTKEFLSYFGLEKLEQLPPLPSIIEFLSQEGSGSESITTPVIETVSD